MKKYCLIVSLSLLILGIITVAPRATLARTSVEEVQQVGSLIGNLIHLIAIISGLTATGFLLSGSLRYVTNADQPLAMRKLKRTITLASIGLALTAGAFLLKDVIDSLAVSIFGF